MNLEIGGTSYPATYVDEYIRESIRQANGQCHPETGHYATLHIHGIADLEEAHEVRKAIYRSAIWLHRNAGLNCSVTHKFIKHPDKTYSVQYTVYNKDHAYAYMVNHYGPDQTKWPYSTNRFHKNYGA
jgi:hypothetical protein